MFLLAGIRKSAAVDAGDLHIFSAGLLGAAVQIGTAPITKFAVTCSAVNGARGSFHRAVITVGRVDQNAVLRNR